MESVGVFRASEVAVALELFDASCRGAQPDYTVLGAFGVGEALLGYACYGPTPGAVNTWDLYWMVVAREAQRQGIGARLWEAVETNLRASAARLCVVETSGRADYAGARRFYARLNFDFTARVPDFYDDGDDRVIYTKRLSGAIG